MNRILINKGKRIVKTCSSDRKSSLIQNDISSCLTKNVPKQACRDIDKVIANEKDAEIYGSVAQKSHSYATRRVNDLDVVVHDPHSTASKIQSIIQRKGISSNVTPCNSPNSYNVIVKKNGKTVKAVDIHPLNEHGKRFPAIYGKSSLPPEKIGKFSVQSVKDQMLRKANYVFTHADGDTKRTVKDESDFVAITRLRLDEKQLQAEAELKRVQKARKDLEKVKHHVRKHRGWNNRDYPLNKDPIPERQEQKFITFAVKHPDKDVRNITLKNNKVVSIPQKKKKKLVEMLDPNNKVWNYWRM